METLMITAYNNAEEAKAAYDQLLEKPQNDGYLISQQIVLAKGHGMIKVLERYNAGVGNPTETTLAGMMSDLVRMVGGPLGALFFGDDGLLGDGVLDNNDSHGRYSLIEQILAVFKVNGYFLITIAQEDDKAAYDKIVGQKYTDRFDAAEAKTDIEYAYKIHRKLKKEALKLARARRGEFYAERCEENRRNLQKKFDEIRN